MTEVLISPDLVSDLERLARLFKAPHEMLQAVDKLSSISNAVREAETRHAALVADEEAAAQRAAQAKVDADAAIAAETARVEQEREKLKSRIFAATSEATIAETRRAELQAEVADLETRAAAIRKAVSSVRV